MRGTNNHKHKISRNFPRFIALLLPCGGLEIPGSLWSWGELRTVRALGTRHWQLSLRPCILGASLGIGLFLEPPPPTSGAGCGGQVGGVAPLHEALGYPQRAEGALRVAQDQGESDKPAPSVWQELGYAPLHPHLQ